ncbi:hypothetical protein JK635_07665 [Neobacillus sp. YIM B02564]|uniref:Uncharacterized protein n=1 Tax=Neobacillus paridis TaxID=2803862 RepID=A0ABS1TLA0_9BACI|nr:hypothetical protein [Neobacillus paridis]MBL4952086.1 hypothetical protein [Neobacillus paridis]
MTIGYVLDENRLLSIRYLPLDSAKGREMSEKGNLLEHVIDLSGNLLDLANEYDVICDTFKDCEAVRDGKEEVWYLFKKCI